VTFEDWTAVAAMEAELIQFETRMGLNVEAARRPLTDQEIAAGTRFGDLDAIVTMNTAAGEEYVELLYTIAAAAILLEVFGEDEGALEDAVEVAALVVTLRWVMAERPALYLDAVRRAQPELHRLISQSYDGGIITVAEEARRQGVDTARWNRPGVSPVAGLLAADVAGHPINRTVERLLKELQSPRRAVAGTITRADLTQVITGTTRDGTRDILHQSNQAALALGRIDIVRALTVEPSQVFSSEILDTNTCGPCRAVDGRTYATVAEAAADYPAGYARCSGGSRCRGVLVFLWDV
jgi:hypothetical protein